MTVNCLFCSLRQLHLISSLFIILCLPSHLHSEYPPHGLSKMITDFSLQFKQEWDRVEALGEGGREAKEDSVRSKRRSAPDLGRAGEGELER